MRVENTDFQNVIALLVEGNVRFVLIGGLAMISHGASHITTDIDISYESSAQNLISLVKVLKSCHARLRNGPPICLLSWMRELSTKFSILLSRRTWEQLICSLSLQEWTVTKV